MQSDQGRLAKYCTENIKNTVVIAANEPSLALFRIQVRVGLSTPSFTVLAYTFSNLVIDT